jgi:hypothetical protein
VDEEDANTKDEAVKLGAEAYKRVFPDAVWPGAIPGGPPISFRSRTGVNWQDDESGSRTAFELPTLQVLTAGTLGEHVAFFVGAHLFEDGSFDAASVDRFYIQLNDLFMGKAPENLINLRFGQFIPELVPFASNHRGMTITPYAFNTYSPAQGSSFSAEHVHAPGNDHGDEHAAPSPGLIPANGGHAIEDLTGPSFGLENFQLGVQISGLVQSRVRYALGIVNGGIGEENNANKDLYGRLAYKLGGMTFDGTAGANASDKNWAERSLSLGVFGYRGYVLNETGLGPEDLVVMRGGLDLSWYFDNLNLYGGYLHGVDDFLDAAEVVEVSYDMFFAEANYVFYPWLIGVLRYETASPEGIDTIHRIVPNITLLHRANIKFQLETRLNPDDLEFNTLLAGIDFAY